SYYKLRFDNKIAINSETILKQYTPFIKNYYRFSFDINDFPKSLIKGILDKNSLEANNSIVILLQGKFGNFGETFFMERSYKMKDIIIAKETELIIKYTEKDGKIYSSKPQWSNINKIIPYEISEKKEIINKLKSDLQAIKKEEIA
ncbi:MAG: hypothetical protein GXO27_03460, partial [Chlorobi bacterium]|nr:hypothetical protein [Chlorobiota bacterium]